MTQAGIRADHTQLTQLVDAVRHAWPEHDKFLNTRLEGRSEAHLRAAEELAALVLQLAGHELRTYIDDYRWMCARVLEEELHFRRTGNYRITSFEDAVRNVYADTEFMTKYMNGLLLSQVLWTNHTDVFDHYLREFIATNAEGYRHLEVGPGHGLFLVPPARDPKCGTCSAWDISDASLASARESLDCLKVPKTVALEKQSVLGERVPTDKYFDSIVISEVLEHLETPEEALRNLRQVVTDGGRIFVNVPINSPAPDHIYLLRTPQEVVDIVAKNGWNVADSWAFPATGYTASVALKHQLTMSVVVIGTPA